MAPHRSLTYILAAVALLAAGCATQAPAPIERLAPEAPAAKGLPPRQPADTPSPLLARPPFGLYAHYPSNDTLATLSIGPVSPDGRYRAALTGQGAWIARVDGAWLWQLELPIPKPPAPPPDPPGTQSPKPATPPAAPAKQPVPVGPLVWTPQGALLFQDDTGAWHLANPEAAQITPMAAVLTSKEGVTFSPDGKQVSYYTPGKTGRQLWVAAADGTGAKLMGENVTGFWEEATGQLVVQKVAGPPATTGGPDKAPGMDPLLNKGQQKQ